LLYAFFANLVDVWLHARICQIKIRPAQFRLNQQLSTNQYPPLPCSRVFLKPNINSLWFFFCCEGPRSRCYGRPQPLSLLCNPVMNMIFPLFLVMEHRWNKTDTKKPKYSEKKHVPEPICPPQISRGLTRNRTRASAVRDRRITD
jgi:hypothetical protein